MIESLFGDLGPPLGGHPIGPRRLGESATLGTAADDETVAGDWQDLVVDSAPAVAIRAHFAQHRGDLVAASPMVTLIDPSQLWAAQVVQALSDAAGQALQRLNLRDRHTLRTLAVIERTLVPRRSQPPLRVYCTTLRGTGSELDDRHDDIATALAEGSQLAAVLVGTLQPQALTGLLLTLLAACRHPAWRCPQLLFLVPPGASGLHQRILGQSWPAGVAVDVVAEPLGSASGVWNRLLAAWELRCRPRSTATGAPAAVVPAATPPAWPRAAAPCDALRPEAPGLRSLLWPLQHTDGMLACGVIDLRSGDLLVSQASPAAPAESSALAEAAQALWRAREGCRQALPGQAAPDEVLLSAGARQLLLRPLPNDPGLGFVAVVARAQANLALLRFKLLGLEQAVT